MKDFAVYEYEIIRPAQGNLNFTENMIQQNLAQKRENFGKLFVKGTQMKLYQQKSNGEMPDLFENYVVQVERDVVILQVNRTVYKTLIEPADHTVNGVPAYEPRKAKSLPLGYVIIDNREGHGFIMMEKNTAWGKVPKTLCELLQESLGRLLFDNYGLGISISAKLQPTEFSEFVDQQCQKNKDVVKRITIDYLHAGGANDKWKSMSGRGTKSLRALADTGDKFEAIRSTFSMEFQELHKDKIRDMVRLAQLCGEYDYKISVKFNDFGLYKSNSTIVAFYSLDVQPFDNFITGQTYTDTETGEVTYALLLWLDDKWNKTKELENEAKTPGK